MPIGALHLCPNLRNPTTDTLSIKPRERIADVALRRRVAPIKHDLRAFHAGVAVPKCEEGCSGAAARLRELGVAALAASAFVTDRDPPSALRLCLGGAQLVAPEPA